MMLEKPAAPPLTQPSDTGWYGLGWMVSPWNDTSAALNWWHGGYFPGSRAELVRLGNGVIWAAVFNSDTENATDFAQEFTDTLDRIAMQTTVWPAHDLFPNYYPGR
jgi:hypothetical protein